MSINHSRNDFNLGQFVIVMWEQSFKLNCSIYKIWQHIPFRRRMDQHSNAIPILLLIPFKEGYHISWRDSKHLHPVQHVGQQLTLTRYSLRLGSRGSNGWYRVPSLHGAQIQHCYQRWRVPHYDWSGASQAVPHLEKPMREPQDQSNSPTTRQFWSRAKPGPWSYRPVQFVGTHEEVHEPGAAVYSWHE